MTLPSMGEEFLNGTARVSGWGAIRAGGSVSDALLYVDVPIVEDEGKCSVYAM